MQGSRRKAEILLDRFMPVHYRNVQGLMDDLSDARRKAQLVGLLNKIRAKY